MELRHVDADKLRRTVGGTFFGVTFIKRTNGQRRRMVCRLGVKKDLRGGEPAYDPSNYDLLPVYDVQNHGYRSIPLDAICEPIRARGGTI